MGPFCRETPNSNSLAGNTDCLITAKLTSEHSFKKTEHWGCLQLGSVYTSPLPEDSPRSPGISWTCRQFLRKWDTRWWGVGGTRSDRLTQGQYMFPEGQRAGNWQGRWRLNPSCSFPTLLWHTSCDIQLLPRIWNNGWEAELMQSHHFPGPLTWFTTKSLGVYGLRISLKVGGSIGCIGP